MAWVYSSAELRSHERTGKLTLRATALEDPDELINLFENSVPDFLSYPECLPERDMRSLFINKMRHCSSWNELQAAVGTLLEQLILRQYSVHETENASAKMEELLLEEEKEEKKSSPSWKRNSNEKKSPKKQKKNKKRNNTQGMRQLNQRSSHANEDDQALEEPVSETQKQEDSSKRVTTRKCRDGEDPAAHSALNASQCSSASDNDGGHDLQGVNSTFCPGTVDVSNNPIGKESDENRVSVDPSASPVLIQVGKDYGGAGVIDHKDVDTRTSSAQYSDDDSSEWVKVGENCRHSSRRRYTRESSYVETAPLEYDEAYSDEHEYFEQASKNAREEKQSQPSSPTNPSCNPPAVTPYGVAFDPNVETARQYQQRIYFLQMYQQFLNQYMQQSRRYPSPQVQAMAHAQAYAEVFGTTVPQDEHTPAQMLPMHMYPGLMAAQSQVVPPMVGTNDGMMQPQGYFHSVPNNIISVYQDGYVHSSSHRNPHCRSSGSSSSSSPSRRLRANAAEFVPTSGSRSSYTTSKETTETCSSCRRHSSSKTDKGNEK